MARRALTASLVLSPFAVALAMQGCTQDFGTFDPTGAGGADTPTTTTSGDSTTATTTGSSPTTTTGPGGGAGGGTPCEDASECNDGEPCTTDACEGGFCTNTPVEDGTLEPGYVDDTTDCVVVTCVGGTGVEGADEDDDPPEDALACAERVCDGTSIVDDPSQPIRDNEPCGESPLVCTDGLCVGCDDAADCPQPPGACQVPICDDDGVCGAEVTDEDPDDEVDDDCRTPTCDGVSADIVFVADEDQTPTDTACGVGTCTGMTASVERLDAGEDCNIGDGVCDGDGTGAGSCVECVNDSATGTDAGCGGPRPHCDDSGVPNCVECIPGGATPHLGCNAGTPICDPTGNGGNGDCVVCYDDGTQAVGCADPGTDQCDEAPGGGECFDVCYNVDPGADPGCDDPALPHCAEGPQACRECTQQSDCAGNPSGTLCNQDGNTTCGCAGGTNSAQCTDSPRGDDCIAGACGCNDDDDCPGDCDTDTGVCE